MTENKPVPVTDHVVVAPETIGDGLESETPPHPNLGRPSWQPLRDREVWGWIGAGVAGVLIIELFAAVVYLLWMTQSW